MFNLAFLSVTSGLHLIVFPLMKAIIIHFSYLLVFLLLCVLVSWPVHLFLLRMYQTVYLATCSLRFLTSLSLGLFRVFSRMMVSLICSDISLALILRGEKHEMEVQHCRSSIYQAILNWTGGRERMKGAPPFNQSCPVWRPPLTFLTNKGFLFEFMLTYFPFFFVLFLYLHHHE